MLSTILFFLFFFTSFTIILKFTAYNNAPLSDILTYEKYEDISERWNLSYITHFLAISLLIGSIFAQFLTNLTLLPSHHKDIIAVRYLLELLCLTMMFTGAYLISLGLALDPRGYKSNAPMFRMMLIFASVVLACFCIHYSEIISSREVEQFWTELFTPMWEYIIGQGIIGITSDGVMWASTAMVFTYDSHGNISPDATEEQRIEALQHHTEQALDMQEFCPMWEEDNKNNQDQVFTGTMFAMGVTMTKEVHEQFQAKQQAELDEIMEQDWLDNSLPVAKLHKQQEDMSRNEDLFIQINEQRLTRQKQWALEDAAFKKEMEGVAPLK